MDENTPILKQFDDKLLTLNVGNETLDLSSKNGTLYTANPDSVSPNINTDGVATHQQDTGVGKTPDSLSFGGMSRHQKFTLISMASVNFGAAACFSLLAPFFPKEAKAKGSSDTVTGLIFSSFEFVIFITAPFFGNFITRIGSKFMFVAGISVCGTCAILFGLLDKCPDGIIFIVMCFLCRTVEALGASAFVTASFAIIAHTFPGNVATVFGSLETFGGLGMMVGPPIGGALYQVGGYGPPFWVMGGMLLLFAVSTAYYMPSPDDAYKPYQGSILTLLRSPLTWLIGFSVVAGSFALGFLDPTLATHLNKLPDNLNYFLIGLIFLCAPGVYALTAPLWGYIGDKKGYIKTMIFGGNLCSAVTFLLLGPAPFLPFLPFSLWLQIVALSLMGLFLGCALIPTFKAFLYAAKTLGFEDDNFNTYGIVSGFFNSCFSLGAFIGPSIGGILVQNFDFDWAAVCCAGLFTCAGLLLLVYSCCQSTERSGYERLEGEDVASP